MDRSAEGVTGVATVDSLLSGSGSGVSLSTAAVLTRLPAAEGETLARISSSTTAPAARVPRGKAPP